MKRAIVGEDVFEGETADAIVRQMRAADWGSPDTKKEYMDGVRERVQMIAGVVVRTDTADHFLRDLETAGMFRLDGFEKAT
jgi:hypothetical protein